MKFTTLAVAPPLVSATKFRDNKFALKPKCSVGLNSRVKRCAAKPKPGNT